MTKNIKIITTALILSFFIIAPSLSTKLPIGEQCTSNSDCKSNDCETSAKTDSTGSKLSFCDCDELDLSITGGDSSQDCADRYGGTKDDWTCKDGADATWDLDYCLHNKDVNKTKSPIPPKDPSFIDHILDPTIAYTSIYENEIENIVKRKPLLQIGIPGLESFSEGKTTEIEGSTYVHIPFLSEYLAALYRYGVVAASIFAVVMIINNGLKWSISGGSPEKIKEAQTRILQSITGLLLAIGSYALLFNINPELVQFKNLRIQAVQGVALNNLESSMAEHGSHSPSSLDSSAAPTAGTFRSVLYGSDVCGDKNGLDLPTYKQRVDKLIPIVDAWKQLSFDQGGSLYIRGMSAKCSPKHTLRQEDYQLNAIANIYAAYPTFFSAQDRKDPCFSVVSELSTNKKSSTSDATTLREKKKIASKTCLPYINNIYQKSILPRANKAGLTCADCIGWLRLLHRECFDKKNKKTIDHRVTAGRACSDVGTEELTEYLFRLKTKETNMDTKIKEIMPKLKFGDIIHWAKGHTYGSYSGGHYFMYTGGVGLDYEIIEMGSGGRADLVNKSGGAKKAVANMGMPDLEWAGVRAIKDAEDFIKRSFSNSRDRVACAWRPLEDSHFNN